MMTTKYIQVGTHRIGYGYPCFVIAEASSNHGRSLRRAKRMIEAASDAGAQAVKFQIFSAETVAADTADPRTIVRAKEKSAFVDKDTKLIDLYRPNELPRAWLPKLAAYARKLGLIFLATPFDEKAVDQLEGVGVPMHKVASYEMLDVSLLRKFAVTKKPILLSTGMADLKDIAASLNVLNLAKSGPVILLHCRSMYPTPPEDVDLRAMEVMRKRFNLQVGFSDHTLGIAVPIAAAALGATVIEKHFYLDDGVHTIDDTFSLNPDELTIMVQGIKQAETAVGLALKKPTQAEFKERMWRRSLWVIKDIKQGELLSKENVISLRPNLGLSPLYIDRILGKRAKKNIAKNSPLTRKMIKGL